MSNEFVTGLSQYAPTKMTQYESGATRSSNEGRPNYMGYIGWKAIRRFGDYMLRHEVQADGTRRKAGNWKLGMSIQRYLESFGRHMVDWGLLEENPETALLGKLGCSITHLEEMQEVACALIFNLQGFLQETEKVREQHYGKDRVPFGGGTGTAVAVDNDRDRERAASAPRVRPEEGSVGAGLFQKGEARSNADAWPRRADPADLRPLPGREAQLRDQTD